MGQRVIAPRSVSLGIYFFLFLFGGSALAGSLYPAPFFPTPMEPWDMARADFNNDGHVDLVVPGWDTNYLLVLLGRGEGNFEFLTLDVEHPQGVDVGDFNEDGAFQVQA